MTLHFVEEGDGTPVVALHGFTLDHRVMHGCLEPVFAARPGYRRIYPDLPGMGRTPAPETVAGSDDVLAAVHSFLDTRLGDTPFLLVGESWGGYLARAVARDRPAQVRGLALICPIGAEVWHAKRTVPDHVVLRAEPGLDATHPEFAAEMVAQTAETLRRFDAEIMTGVALADAAAIGRISANYALSSPPERDGAPFDRPTLIVTGRQDATVGYLDQFALLPHYPRATYAVLDVAGHSLQIEQPALFAALIGEWLDRAGAQ